MTPRVNVCVQLAVNTMLKYYYLLCVHSVRRRNVEVKHNKNNNTSNSVFSHRVDLNV